MPDNPAMTAVPTGRAPRGLPAGLSWLRSPGATVPPRVTTVVLALCVIVTSLPFLWGALPYTYGHDLFYHLERIESVAQGIAEGRLPTWLYNVQAYGYGYPAGVCYPHTFLLPFALLRLIGVSLTGSYRALVVATNVATAALSYACFRRMFCTERVALVCSVLWMLAPYRLVDIYLRAAVGEYLALVFVPLIAYGLWHICLDDATAAPSASRSFVWLPLALGMTGVVQSHVLSVILLLLPGLPIVVVLLVLGRRTRPLSRMLGALGIATLVSVVLCANFIVPLFDYCLHESLFASVVGTWQIPMQNAVEPFQVLGAFWPFRGESEVSGDPLLDMPTPVGCALALMFIAGVITMLVPRTRRALTPAGRVLLPTLLVVAALLAWMATTLFPWDLELGEGPVLAVLFITVVGVIQFPWRCIGSISFVLVLVAGITLCVTRGRPRAVLVGACLTLAVAEAASANVTFLANASRLTASDIADILGKQTWSIGFGEYLNANFDANQRDTYDRLLRDTDTLTVGGWEHESAPVAELTVRNSARTAATVVVPLLYNTRWEVADVAVTGAAGGEATRDVARDVTLTEVDGYVGVVVPAGLTGVVNIAFVAPASWYVANLVSLTSAVVLALYVWHARRARRATPARHMSARRDRT